MAQVTEQDLRDVMVPPEEVGIIEINPTERDILLCKIDGTLIGTRHYAVGSPMDDVVKLLRRLVALGYRQRERI